MFKIFVLLALLPSCGVPNHRKDELLRKIIHKIYATGELENIVKILSGFQRTPEGDFIRSRNIYHPDMQTLVDFIYNYLKREGINVEKEGFLFEPFSESVTLYNITAELKGSKDSVFVLSAHYDSSASRDSSWNAQTEPAPGANDNASGTAAVMLAAKVLKDYEFENTIRFLLFTAEELGLVGSRYYAYFARKNSEKIGGVINLDMIGYNHPENRDSIYLIYDSLTDSSEIAEKVKWVNEYFDINLRIADADGFLDMFGDHFFFWVWDYPAVHIGTFPIPPEYHTTSDTPDKIDFKFLGKITALVTATVADLAGIASAR